MALDKTGGHGNDPGAVARAISRSSCFSGTLVSDAFSGYKSLDENDENIHSVFCWAHARRDYADALKALKREDKNYAHETVAHKALVQINAIYKAEEADCGNVRKLFDLHAFTSCDSLI